MAFNIQINETAGTYRITPGVGSRESQARLKLLEKIEKVIKGPLSYDSSANDAFSTHKMNPRQYLLDEAEKLKKPSHFLGYFHSTDYQARVEEVYARIVKNFSDLPPEVVNEIMARVDLRDINSLARVNRSLSQRAVDVLQNVLPSSLNFIDFPSFKKVIAYIGNTSSFLLIECGDCFRYYSVFLKNVNCLSTLRAIQDSAPLTFLWALKPSAARADKEFTLPAFYIQIESKQDDDTSFLGRLQNFISKIPGL